MKKQNILKITLSTAVLIVAVLFTGCQRNPFFERSAPKISFDISNAEAIAGLEGTANRSARAADSNALLQRIFEDGTVDSAMDINGKSLEKQMSYIDYVILPPDNVDSNEVYLLLKDYSYVKTTLIDTGNYWALSPLLCIHEDNSYDDVLLSSPYVKSFPYVIEYKETIQFLKDGTLLYLCRSPVGDHFYLKKWNPKTKETTDICSIQRTDDLEFINIDRFSIDKTEDYVYMHVDTVKTDGTGSKNIKIIRISDPSFSKEIQDVTGWCYNPHDDHFYYSKYYNAESASGLYKSNKDGSNPTRLHSEMFAHLIPQSAQKVWGLNGHTDEDYSLQNICSEQTSNEMTGTLAFSEQFHYSAPEYHYFWGDYIIINSNLYLKHSHDLDGMGSHKDSIISIPLNGTDSDIKNLLAFNTNINLHSWSVNKNYLFISGTDYETKEPVNCRIDLKTGEQLTIQSDEAFGAIAAL